MASVSVRDLRNHGGEVLERVNHGETVTITRDGHAVAELRPLPRKTPAAHELIARRASLPPVDPSKLRRDVDELLDPAL